MVKVKNTKNKDLIESKTEYYYRKYKSIKTEMDYDKTLEVLRTQHLRKVGWKKKSTSNTKVMKPVVSPYEKLTQARM